MDFSLLHVGGYKKDQIRLLAEMNNLAPSFLENNSVTKIIEHSPCARAHSKHITHICSSVSHNNVMRWELL